MATAVATPEACVRRTKAFRIGFRITKPLSQKTGMDTIQPIMRTARDVLFFPTSRTTQSAILSAAPVFSKRAPTSAPIMMTMPMLLKVPAKPALTTSAIPRTLPVLTKGMPPIMPKITETVKMDRKG